MSDLKLILEYGGAVRRFAVCPSEEHSDQLNATKDALLWHCESQAKRIAELEAITKIECGLHDCLVMPREDDPGPLFYQPANSTLVLAKLRDYAIIPKAKYRELEAAVAALRVARNALKAELQEWEAAAKAIVHMADAAKEQQ